MSAPQGWSSGGQREREGHRQRHTRTQIDKVNPHTHTHTHIHIHTHTHNIYIYICIHTRIQAYMYTDYARTSSSASSCARRASISGSTKSTYRRGNQDEEGREAG